jgi:hypothetical protein
LRSLAKLESGGKPLRSDRELVTWFARGLVDVQQQIDEYGWLRDGYPPNLQRSFDIAAATNLMRVDDRWPTSLPALTRLAEKPLFEWVQDLSWDPDGQFTAAALIESGEVSHACIDLAMPGKNPEGELIENTGYKLLRGVCAGRRDGQSVYVAFRRAGRSSMLPCRTGLHARHRTRIRAALRSGTCIIWEGREIALRTLSGALADLGIA